MLARAPQGGGATREIVDGIEYADWHQAYFFPGARHILEVGNLAGQGLRL